MTPSRFGPRSREMKVRGSTRTSRMKIAKRFFWGMGMPSPFTRRSVAPACRRIRSRAICLCFSDPLKNQFSFRGGFEPYRGCDWPVYTTHESLVGSVVSTDRAVFRKAHCTAFPHGPLRITDPTIGKNNSTISHKKQRADPEGSALCQQKKVN